MHLVTVKDSMTGESYTYDADMPINSADSGLAFYISQLTNLEAKIYETKYRNIIYPELVPVDTSDPEWIDSVSYISYDAVTMGKFIAANGKDLPQSDIDANITTVPVGYAGNSYGYTVEELRKSQQMRIPLDAAKASAAFRGAQEHAQKVAFFGDSSRNMTGLLNNANLALDNSTVDWDTGTGQDIIDDMNGLLIKVWNNSANVHIPDTLLIPSARYAQISSQRMDTGTDTTVLEFFLGTSRFIKSVEPWYACDTAGALGVKRAVAYRPEVDAVFYKMPREFQMLPAEARGLRFVIDCIAEYGGVHARKPKTITYADGI